MSWNNENHFELLPTSTPPYTPAENAEFAEFVPLAKAAFAEKTANSANTAGGYNQQIAYPTDCFLEDYMEFMQKRVESADAFLLGAILPVCGTLLARRVWVDWANGKQYPNLFVMLAGKAGDRKSSCILAVERFARAVLEESSFIPAAFSPETLFDEYDVNPDKIGVVDDANATLTDWRKSVNGERVATRFLELYDCKGLSESFRRNKTKAEDSTPRRSIAETSTNLLFGATFNVACFQDQATRAGMARRFLYYVATRHGRLICRPPRTTSEDKQPVIDSLKGLLQIHGEMDFAQDAGTLWGDFQKQNREQYDNTDGSRDAAASRLASAPMQTLHVAMIFEACRFAHKPSEWRGIIEKKTLQLAIDHVEGCMDAAEQLEHIANRKTLENEAEILLAKIRNLIPATGGFHIATRTALTRCFANSSGARALKPDDIYLRIIPHLARQNEARLIQKEGKREVYAFRAESPIDGL